MTGSTLALIILEAFFGQRWISRDGLVMTGAGKLVLRLAFPLLIPEIVSEWFIEDQ